VRIRLKSAKKVEPLALFLLSLTTYFFRAFCFVIENIFVIARDIDSEIDR
jgi:hypothetical protein